MKCMYCGAWLVDCAIWFHIHKFTEKVFFTGTHFPFRTINESERALCCLVLFLEIKRCIQISRGIFTIFGWISYFLKWRLTIHIKVFMKIVTPEGASHIIISVCNSVEATRMHIFSKSFSNNCNLWPGLSTDFRSVYLYCLTLLCDQILSALILYKFRKYGEFLVDGLRIH